MAAPFNVNPCRGPCRKTWPFAKRSSRGSDFTQNQRSGGLGAPGLSGIPGAPGAFGAPGTPGAAGADLAPQNGHSISAESTSAPQRGHVIVLESMVGGLKHIAVSSPFNSDHLIYRLVLLLLLALSAPSAAGEAQARTARNALRLCGCRIRIGSKRSLF